MCFIDYATRCGLEVEAANYKSPYGLQGCTNWLGDKYCDYKKELDGKDDEVIISYFNQIGLGYQKTSQLMNFGFSFSTSSHSCALLW